MTNTRSHRTIKTIAAGLIVSAAAALTIATGLAHSEPAQAPASAAVQAPTAGLSDLEDEVWWTTTDCPEGVQVPCLDPEADRSHLPADVQAEYEALGTAQWRCFGVYGYDTSGAAIYPTDADRVSCRQYAYLSTDPTRVQLGEDSEALAYDCRLDGNRMCGPGNQQGVPAGDYSATAAACETDRECAALDRQV